MNPETLLKADTATVTLEALKDGKIRATSSLPVGPCARGRFSRLGSDDHHRPFSQEYAARMSSELGDASKRNPCPLGASCRRIANATLMPRSLAGIADPRPARPLGLRRRSTRTIRAGRFGRLSQGFNLSDLFWHDPTDRLASYV